MTRLCGLLALALLGACGSDPVAPPQTTKEGPALWQVKRGDLNGWLFGTIHVLPPKMNWRSERIDAAMTQADTLVLEAADLQDEDKTLATFEEMARSPGLPPIEARVPAAEKPALEKLLSESGTGAQAYAGYESWAAAMLLSAATQAKLGISATDGVEPVLIAAFRQAGKPIGGLETVERQFGAFDGLPERAQRALLVQTVQEAKDMRGLYDRILKAWAKGDMAALADEDRLGVQPDPEVEEAILIARNRDWVGAVERLKGRPFIAVGAGHLTGRDNLIDLLKAKGFTVTRVQ
ncbi:MAG: TraB/GumN family protein [Sphingobium sp.]